MKKYIVLAATLASCLQCQAGTLSATDIYVAVKRGQQTVEPSVLPLVCLTIVTDRIALPLEILSIQEIDTHDLISARLEKKLGHSESEVLTAIQGDHQSLSMVILHLKPGRYWLSGLYFEGRHRTEITFDLLKPIRYYIIVKPGCVNYVGSLVVSTDWESIRQPRSGESVDFSCRLGTEQTAQRDKKWAADVVPGMAHLPSVESSIQRND
jgi:hypothetical protein